MTREKGSHLKNLNEIKPFVDHLDDVRSTFLKIIVCVLCATVICFYFSPLILDILKYPLTKTVYLFSGSPSPDNILRSLNPSGAFVMAIKMAVSCAIIITLPLTLYFISIFLLPALTEKEKKYLTPVFFTGTALFILGLMFCYSAVLPLSLKFLWGFARWIKVQPDWTLEYYVTFVTRFLFVFGLVFETPVLILGLVKMGLLSYHTLKTKRRVVVVLIFVISATLTPPDVLTQVLMALPLIVLYEISVWGAYYIDRNRIASGKLAG